MTDDQIVTDDGLRLAVRDFGGSGTPVLLLHGAGGTLETWTVAGPALAEHHRVVAFDLRGHGHSDEGDWSWEALLRDVDAVATALDLDRPAIVGESLGGMVAALWARAHPECPGAVNLDGHPWNALAPYQGMAAEEVDALLEQLRGLFAAQAAVLAAPLSEEVLDQMLAQQTEFGVASGLSDEAVRARVDRRVVRREGGVFARPGPVTMAAIEESFATLDLLPVYEEIDCPMLVVIAQKDLPGFDAFRELSEAKRTGLTMRLAELAEAGSSVRAVGIDATHGMMLEQPHAVVRLVSEFLA